MTSTPRPEHPAPEPYTHFNPQEYLEEYYAQLSEENAFLLDFYHETYDRLPAGLSVLELGGGPTLYQLLSASRRAREIVFTDFLEVNRRVVERWLEAAPGETRRGLVLGGHSCSDRAQPRVHQQV